MDDQRGLSDPSEHYFRVSEVYLGIREHLRSAKTILAKRKLFEGQRGLFDLSEHCLSVSEVFLCSARTFEVSEDHLG